MHMSDQATAAPELLTGQELATALKISYFSVNEMAKSGQIPFVQVGFSPRNRRYILDEVIKALNTPVK